MQCRLVLWGRSLSLASAAPRCLLRALPGLTAHFGSLAPRIFRLLQTLIQSRTCTRHVASPPLTLFSPHEILQNLAQCTLLSGDLFSLAHIHFSFVLNSQTPLEVYNLTFNLSQSCFLDGIEGYLKAERISAASSLASVTLGQSWTCRVFSAPFIYSYLLLFSPPAICQSLL